MNRKFLALLPLFGLLVFTGCGDSHDKVMRDMIRETNRMIAVMEGIESAADAKAAKGKLEAITKRMESIKVRMDKLGDPSPEKQKELQAKYETEMTEMMTKMVGASMKMMNPEISKELGSVMSKMPGL